MRTYIAKGGIKNRFPASVEGIRLLIRMTVIYVLTDMLGSSVNNSAVRIVAAAGKYCCYCGNERVPLILSLARERCT